MSTPPSDALAAEFRKACDEWPVMSETEGIKAWFWFVEGARQREAIGTAPNSELIAEIEECFRREGDPQSDARLLQVLGRCHRVLLSAQQQPPREPTEAMMMAHLRLWQGSVQGANEYGRAAWQAMWDAALPQAEKD